MQNSLFLDVKMYVHLLT